MIKRTSLHLFICLLSWAWTGVVSAQDSVRFGPPVRADAAPLPENLLALSMAQPPRDLANGAEVIVISGYEPSSRSAGGSVQVSIDRPNSRVLLVLTSYEKVNWNVVASPETTVAGVLVSGYYPPTLATSAQTQGFMTKLPYAYELDGAGLKGLLARLNALFGIERADVFRGSYSIPRRVDIHAVDAPRVELTLAGPAPRVPRANFEFELLAADYSSQPWSLVGPARNARGGDLGEGKVAVNESGATVYRLHRDQLEILDRATGESVAAVLPSNFPRFSWAMDIAFDTKRKIVSVVTLGGEGFLYRFDARERRWMDFRSLNNVDIFSLAYDRKGDRYVAWTEQGSLIIISGEGEALFSRLVEPRLEGFRQLYDRGNSRVPRLAIAAKGDDVALLFITGGAVHRIWHYDIRTNEAVLTFREN